MTALVLSSQIPSGVIDDFDLVTVDGRLLLCAGDGSGGYTWEPSEDRWTKYRLDLPYRPADFRAMVGHLPTEDDQGYRLYSVCAAVVDGRIVVGGGNYEEPFAQWDLASGAVRAHARPDDCGTGKTTTVWLNGRPFFISCGAYTYLWDVERTDAEPVQLHGDRDTVAGIAAGTLNGRPVVVFGDYGDDRVVVWDVDTRSVFREFPCPVPVADIGLAVLDGRTWVVAAGGNRVILGDPDTGAWEWEGPIDEDSIEFDEADEETENFISCMDIGVVGGSPVAVTGSEDGRVCVWSLAERRLVQGHSPPGTRARSTPSVSLIWTVARSPSRRGRTTGCSCGTLSGTDVEPDGSRHGQRGSFASSVPVRAGPAAVSGQWPRQLSTITLGGLR